MQKYDVAIIGAGIVGTAAARWLSRYDLDVALLDKGNDVSMGATKANSAIVHGGYAESGSTLRGRGFAIWADCSLRSSIRNSTLVFASPVPW